MKYYKPHSSPATLVAKERQLLIAKKVILQDVRALRRSEKWLKTVLCILKSIRLSLSSDGTIIKAKHKPTCFH